jgi:DNA replication protein DnaC
MPARSRPADTTAGTFRPTAAVLTSMSLPPPGGASADPPTVGDPDAPEECPTCQGAGYLRQEVPVGHPEFGRLVKCTCRLAIEQRQDQEGLYTLSNLGAYRSRTFATFVPRPGLAGALDAAQAFADRPKGWLILCGTYGVGKTHLAAAIANVALLNGIMTCFAVVPDLLDHLRATFAPTSAVAFDSRFETVRAVDLLILDDLGTENTTPWACEKLYQLINYRWIASLPTVITTNVPFDQMDPRIVSRIRDQDLCQVLVITASDYRQRDNLAPAWNTPVPAGPAAASGARSGGSPRPGAPPPRAR